jgi:predicted CoA-binding protein
MTSEARSDIDTKIDQILSLKTWAIVGLSNNPDRAAFGVSKLLKERGHRIVPVHPNAEPVHGESAYKTLSEIPFPIVVDQAIEIGAKAVWLQLEVIDEAAFQRAERAGLLAVMNRCPAIEYKKRAN